MRVIPFREYLMYQAWREEEWNRPSRSDYYVMALTSIVCGIFGKVESDLDNLKIVFSTGPKKDPTIKSKEYVDRRLAEVKAKIKLDQSKPRRPGPRPEGRLRGV